MSQSEAHNRLRSLYDEHFDLVWAALAVHGVRDDEREDLVQEVWLLAHRRLRRLKPGSSARAWLWSITHNIVRLHRRTAQRRDRKLRAIEEVGRVDPSVPRAHEDRVAAQQVLRTLPVQQREVLVLTHHLGYSGPEIADLLGVSLNTVHSRLRLAKARVREGLQPSETRAARGRCWAAVAAGLASPSPSLLVSTWAKAVCMAVVAVVVVAWGLEDSRTKTAEPSASDRVIVPALTDVGDRFALPPGVDRSSVSLAAVQVPAPRSPVEAPDSSRSSTPPRPAGAKPSRQRSMPSLSADVGLVRQGLEFNRAGHYDRALATFENHARRFPHSPVWDARDSGWVRALCGLGRDEQAQKRARGALARGGSRIALNNSLASCTVVTNSAGAGHLVSP